VVVVVLGTAAAEGSSALEGTAGTGLKRSGMRSGTAVMNVKRMGAAAAAARSACRDPPANMNE
jgi:hypothetical protein